MAGTGSPFTMDMANQIAQTQGFKGLVSLTMGNNNKLSATADAGMGVNAGQMNDAFQAWMADIHTAAMQNNAVLDGISDALQFGITTTDSAETDNAAGLINITGAISSPFSGGSHFG